MHDPELFSPEKVWTAEQSKLADLLLQTIRAHPGKEDDAIVRECAKQQHSGAITELRLVWNKLQKFPHIFEVAAARGTLMDFDLNGQRKMKQAATIKHIAYRGWKVVLTEYDTLLQKGALEPSMVALMAKLLRQHLPKDVLLHRPHQLRSQKTGPDQLPNHGESPRVQVFPYRSNSKMWALFLVTCTDGDYTLHVLTPEKYDAEAFDWATNHLRCQYKIQQETTHSSWPSGRGSELLLFAGFAKDVLKNAHTKPQEEDGFVAHALDTLRKVRAAAVDANLDEIDELLAENDGLAKKKKSKVCSRL